MQRTTSTMVRHTIDRTKRLARGILRTGNRSLALGALLLLSTSSASVIATTNNAPVFTSLTLSKSVVQEGETVTLTGAFTDPDAGDSHTLLIYWNGDDSNDKQKVQLPAGQTSFQISHTPSDTLPLNKLKVVIYDHQLPPGSNDNTTGGLKSDTEFIPFQIVDSKPQFNSSSIQVSKESDSSPMLTRGRDGDARQDVIVHVTIEGDLQPMESVEAVQVSAAFYAASPPYACTVAATAGRHFRCQYTYYGPSGYKGYPVTLRVKDDEGNLATHQLSVQIP